MRVRFISLFAAFGLLAPMPGEAEPLRHRADFDIQLAGLPFARASFNSFRDDNLYEIEVNFKSAGVGQVVNDMTAELVSTGVIAESGLQSQRYYLQYRKGDRHRRYEADFKDGDVVATRIEPPRDRSKQRNWIPVTESDLKSVTDPLAGLIQPVSVGDPFTCRATPTISRTTPVACGESDSRITTRRPIGFPPERCRRTNASLTMQTRTPDATSRASKARPSRIGTRTVSK